MSEPAGDADPALVEQVRREVELRHLIDEALAKQKKEKESGGFFKHPAVLLVLTFIFTGILGSVLSTCWQNKQWAEQEKYHAAELATQERLETIRYATETIAASVASAEDVLHLFSWSWPAKSEVAILGERAKYWREESRKWRVAEKVLSARVHASFNDKDVNSLLDQIIDDRYNLGNAITNLLWYDDRLHMNFHGKDAREVDRLRGVAQATVVKLTVGNSQQHIEGELQRIARLMLIETERRRPTPTGFFDFLRH